MSPISLKMCRFRPLTYPCSTQNLKNHRNIRATPCPRQVRGIHGSHALSFVGIFFLIVFILFELQQKEKSKPPKYSEKREAHDIIFHKRQSESISLFFL